MQESERLNQLLMRDAPAAWRCLSPLGKAMAFPKGIVHQAAEAKGAALNATIGQITDGKGAPMALPSLSALVPDLDPATTFLYSPVDGPPAIRRKWLARQRALAGDPSRPTALPVATHGIAHGLSLVAALFADPDTDVVVPTPAWDNYELVFGLHAHARIVRFPLLVDGVFNVEGLADALRRTRKKSVVVLNFPNNPTGYQPTTDEVEQLTEVLLAHEKPSVVLTDDAYQGWVYVDGRHKRSLFWDLHERADLDRLFPIKVDGATKELVFFSSRLGFVTHGGAKDAEEALASKMKGLLRGTTGCPSGPALALLDRALDNPSLDSEFAFAKGVLAERHATLKAGLATLPPDWRPQPFHGAFFAFVQLPPEMDAETFRVRLLRDASVGVVAFPDANAIRLAFCSLDVEGIHRLVETLHTFGA